MKRTSLIVTASLAMTLAAIIVWPVADAREKWGPFRGHIVDAETGQPIAGAVVLVVWWELEPNPVQMSQRFYDAREAVTDAKGRFEVPRLSPPFLALRILDPNIDWFAPGYEHAKLVVTPPDAEPFVTSTIIQMRRLRTPEERIRAQRSYPPTIPAQKMPRLLEALNKERTALGLAPVEHGGEK